MDGWELEMDSLSIQTTSLGGMKIKILETNTTTKYSIWKS